MLKKTGGYYHLSVQLSLILLHQLPVLKKNSNNKKNRVNELAKILNKKLIDECHSFAKEVAKNSFTAVKTRMDADIDTGLKLEIYGWALCFAHEDRQKMMSSFLNKGKK